MEKTSIVGGNAYDREALRSVFSPQCSKDAEQIEAIRGQYTRPQKNPQLYLPRVTGIGESDWRWIQIGIDPKSDAPFKALVAMAIDGIIAIDTLGRVQSYNPACERLFGYSADEVIGRNVGVLMLWPDHDEHDAHLSSCGRTGKRVDIGREILGRRKDQAAFPVCLSVGESKIGGQNLFIGIVRDMAAVRAAQREDELSHRHLANIVESSDDIILSKTLDGIATSWNAAAERVLGYTAQELIGQPISIIIPPNRIAEEDDILRRIRAGERVSHYETMRRRKDGTDIVVSLSVSPVRDASGTIIGASTIARDVTERRKAEADVAKLQSELVRVSRLSAMRHMTAAVAHELNQPLTSIANFVNAAKRTLSSLDTDRTVQSAQDMMRSAVTQTLRAGSIIRNLRDFAERRETAPALEDINEVVEEAAALGLFGAADSNVKIQLELDRTLEAVPIDRAQIRQVVLNLIENSMEAIAAATRCELVLSTGPDEPGFIQVTVADTGPGLPDEVVARLFQPFTTTKEAGMGIGLALCHSIVESHGGRIWVLPDVQEGTAFRIRLPVAGRTGSAE